MKMFEYKIAREDFLTGNRKKSRRIKCFEKLNIGGLYVHLGKGYPGCQRIIKLISVQKIDD